MTTHDLVELSLDDIAGVTGGFSLRGLYREAVNGITAGIGGWKLANQMYGHASLQEKWRARGALKEYLDGSDRLPSWAPQW